MLKVTNKRVSGGILKNKDFKGLVEKRKKAKRWHREALRVWWWVRRRIVVMRALELKVIHETCVTSYQDLVTGVSKKQTLYPLTETLNEEWKLELGGLWGYVFNYMANKLCFYQLEKQESFGPFSVSHAYLCGLGGVVFK